MSWKSFAREMEKAQRRSERRKRAYERAVAQTERQRQREEKVRLKELEIARAADLVAQFEHYLVSLVSVHKSRPATWDWAALASAPPPGQPVKHKAQEHAAQNALTSYRPGFFEKMVGLDKKRVAALQAEVPRAQARDAEVHEKALEAWNQEYREWEMYRRLAERILQQDHEVYGHALELAGAFDEVALFQTNVQSGAARSSVVMLTAEIKDDEIVPTEIVKQAASGKLGTKAMPKGQYWELFQDHVCSCALRLACEVFAVLPVERTIVNIGRMQTNSSTGHPELVTYLAVSFIRSQLEGIKLDAIDPSNSMSNFSHRMKFLKSTGFQPVAPITLEDQFITT